ncbi:MAG: hypothetical protein HBSAPP03_19750 [Phycisphaerae bacterium]|nr:MAG: hypothetical protein HBSAPP03_19750 [Phycisphaerae bacterium]
MALMPGCDRPVPPKPAPAPTPAPSPAEPPKVRKDPAQVLSAARAAVEKVQVLSYTGAFVGPGGGEPSAKGEVTATRAEAGGWMMHVKGTGVRSGEGGVAGKSKPFEIGYDGATARSIAEEDSVVYETSAFEWDELLAFMTAQGARPIVAWEVFGEDVLPGADITLAFEGQETLDGVLCDVVRVRPPEGASGPGVRYALGVSDSLPRRIERVGADAGTLTLTSVRTGPDVLSAVYALPTPTGYRIRDPGRAGAKVAGGDVDKGSLLGDPEKKLQASMQPLKVGDAAPAWELKDASGKTVSLADFKGKVVVLDFWGTWCVWCVKAMPAIEAVHKKYADRGVVVLGMNTENDPDADPAGFMKRNNFTYGLVLNAEKITKAYKVLGYPQLYVVGPDGTIVGVEQGYSPDLEEKLSKIIDAALPKN